MRVKIIFFIFLFLIIAAAGFLLAQEAAHKKAVYELTDEQEIMDGTDSWFITASQQATLSATQIVFLKNGETAEFLLPPQYFKTSFSNNGRFFAIQTLAPRESVEKIDRDLTITVYSDEMRELYRLNRKVYYDHTFPAVAVSGDDGSVVLGESDSGVVWFSDGNGNLLKEVVLFPDVDYDLERTLEIDLSDDGSQVAVIASKRGGSPAGSNAPNPDSESHLFLFTREGKELWRKALPEFNSSEVAISPDGQSIVTNSYTISTDGKLAKRAIIFSQKGNIFCQTDLLFKQARFSGDSKFLLLANNQELQLLDLINGKLRWSQKISGQTGMMVDLDISEGGEQVAVLVATNDWDGRQFIYRLPVVTIYDSQGIEIQKFSFSVETYGKPILRFTDHDKNLMIGLGNTLYSYQKK